MDLVRFKDSPAGRVIRVGAGDTGYSAFVPHPLPPSFAIDPELANALSAADRAVGELNGLGRMLPNPHLLIRPFIHREAVLSSRIEGTQANIADLYAFEAGQLELPGLGTAPPAADVREVSNYVRALEYALDRIHTLPISRRFIREIHEILLRGVRGEHATPGEFRRSQNWIGAPGCVLNDATYVPPPVDEMERALDEFERYIQTDVPYPPLLRLAFIHYQFEAIHPFIDGNGRIGRLLMSLLLVHWDLLSIPLLYLSAYFERNRDTYYDLLLAVSERGAWAEWVRFYLAGVEEQAKDTVTRAKRLQDLQREWRARVTQARTSALLLSLVDSLFEFPLLTIPQAAAYLSVTYRSAQLNVKRLVEAGILRQIGNPSYGRVYIADGVLEAIGGFEG